MDAPHAPTAAALLSVTDAKHPTSPSPICDFCGTAAGDFRDQPDFQLLACGRCLVARYCSRACQKKAWSACHKGRCGEAPLAGGAAAALLGALNPLAGTQAHVQATAIAELPSGHLVVAAGGGLMLFSAEGLEVACPVAPLHTVSTAATFMGETLAAPGNPMAVSALVAISDSYFVSGCYAGTVRVWCITWPVGGAAPPSLRMLPSATHHTGAAPPNTGRPWMCRVTALAVLSDGCVVSTCEDATVNTWRVGAEGELALSAVLLHPHGVRGVVALPAASLPARFATGCRNGSVYLWGGAVDAPYCTAVLRAAGTLGEIVSLCALPHGRLAAGHCKASQFSESLIRVWGTAPVAVAVGSALVAETGGSGSGGRGGRPAATPEAELLCSLICGPTVLGATLGGRLVAASYDLDRTVEVWNGLGAGATRESVTLQDRPEAMTQLRDGRLAIGLRFPLPCSVLWLR